MKSINLYFHIPFCKRRCSYCAFYTVKWHDHLENDYMKALIEELASYHDTLTQYRVETLYFGGGTPSLIDPKLIAEVISYCRSSLVMAKSAEVTMEANPDSITCERLEEYRRAGVNRLSIGLQAWQNRLLRYFGRLHDRQTFESAFHLARKSGFTNISVDLIFGIPGQSMQDWQESLRAVAALAPEHISCYSLELDNTSRLGGMYRRGQLQAADDELDRAMYREAQSFLGEHGYQQYELSNFAKPGFACRHNVAFWHQEEFIGMGAGASSYFGGEHYRRLENVTAYLAGTSDVESRVKLDRADLKYDFLILHLRLTGGFKLAVYQQRFGSDIYADFGKQIEQLKEYGLVSADDDTLRLTLRGMDVYNQVVKILAN